MEVALNQFYSCKIKHIEITDIEQTMERTRTTSTKASLIFVLLLMAAFLVRTEAGSEGPGKDEGHDDGGDHPYIPWLDS